MAIFKHSTFSLVLVALISSTAYGDINFMQCNTKEGKNAEEVRAGKGTGFNNNVEGSERTTYGNLCAGTEPFNQNQDNTANEDIKSRVGHPFSKFCDLIDRWDAVQNLMFRGQAPHTVFAPTDAAFSKVDGLISRVNELRLLELHILPQARLTGDLRCGQTYRTLNTLQDRRNNQRSKTRCVSAGTSQQLGPGNTINGLRPTVGEPPNVFRVDEFEGQDQFVMTVNQNQANQVDRETFSSNAISCNGVIHVVDEVLLPGNVNDFRTAGLYGGPAVYNYYNGYNGYNGEPHNHGDYGVRPYYNGGIVGYSSYVSYGGGYYYGPRRGHKGGFKGGKGSKGGKGYRYYNRNNRPRPSSYYRPYFRNLKGEEKGSDEMTISDAEFFGTDGLADIEAKIESVKDEFAEKSDENRKRRLEAMLEPDGSVKV